MRTFQPQPLSTRLATPLLQRKCACGKSAGKGEEECSGCAGARLQREALGSARPAIPDAVHAALRSAGQPLPDPTRSFRQQRLRQDFSSVRVHTDAAAAASARAVDAAAYTVGSHVVFGAGRYAPQTRAGQSLLAHELTHVTQQRGAALPARGDLRMDAPDSAAEREADRAAEQLQTGVDSAPAAGAGEARLARRKAEIPDSTQLTINLGNTARSGLQFTPTNVTDTQVGPVGAQPGLLQGGINRLNVIVGEGLSLQTLAVEILPLWTTATPFRPPGAAAPLPLDLISADELAKALLVYNQYYLQLPQMAKWRAGLRFPLPVDIDAKTGMATLHPLQIRALASGFQAAWAPLLEQRATATAAPLQANLRADVTQFLAANPDALGRGIGLLARALTNAVAEEPFIAEAFRQLGPAGFDVALAFMDNAVNTEIALLANQRDGFAILLEITAATASPPAALSQRQQDSLNRLNTMMAALAGGAIADPPQAMRNRPIKTVDVDTVKLAGSAHDPASDVRQASAMFAQCNVRLNHRADRGVHVPGDAATIAGWGVNAARLGGNSCAGNADERLLSRSANRDFTLSGHVRVFFISALASGANAASCARNGITNPLMRGFTTLGNNGNGRTLGHELGHQLINTGPTVDDHPAKADVTRVMSPNVPGETFTERECTRIHANAP